MSEQNNTGRAAVCESLEDRRLFSGTAIVSAAAASDATVSPSIELTDADFVRIRTQVSAGAHPWIDGWNALTSDGYSQLGVAPRPLATVIRGGTGQNFNQMVIDIQRTYELALRWKIGGDTRYADQAVTFLNAWSSTMTTLTGNADRFLASGLYAFDWVEAADIMRSYSGWASADVARFQNYLVTIYYPMEYDFLTNHNGAYITNYWANWDLANVEGMMAVGLFAGRSDIYSEGLNYLYTGGGNGALAKAFYYLHPGNLYQWQESGRDQGHSVLGMQLFGHIAQMAWNQGTDLYSYNNNAFLAAAEYIAKYNLGYDVPFETYNWGNGQSGSASSQTVIGDGSRGDTDVGFALIYAHYVQMLGIAAPYVTQRVNLVGTEARGSGDEMGFGTLTFALPAVATANLTPTGLTAREKGRGNIELNWFGTSNSTSYNVYRSTSATGTYAKISSSITDLLTYTDQNLPAGTYYYKITGTTTTGETGGSAVVSAIATTALQTQLLFDEGTGTTAADASGKGQTAALVGGATWTTGKSGKAVSLNGTNGYVSLPAGIMSGLSDFTISAWVNLKVASTWARVFDFGDSNGRWMYLTVKNGSGVIEFATSTTYGYNKQSVAGTAIATNQWVHLAVTFSDHVATLYMNGVAVGNNAAMDFPPSEIGSTTQNYLGKSQFSSDPYLNGAIDDFRIYRGAMSAGELYTLATGKTAPPAPVTLTAAANVANSISLVWAAVSGATGYTVQRSTTDGGPYTTIASGIIGTSYLDSAVTIGTKYYYVVSATNLAGAGPSSAQASATPVAAPAVSSWTVDDGSAQRSMVRSLTLNFSQTVNFGTGAFTLIQSGTAVSGVAIKATAVSSMKYILSFSGAAVIGGSLADGRYTLVVSGAAVTNASGIQMASNASYDFIRFFGDIDGNGRVNGLDYAAFQSTYGFNTGSAAYLSAFDFDSNGAVSGIDYAQFRSRYGLALA